MTRRLKSALNILFGRRSWPVPGTPRAYNLEDQVFAALVRPGDVVYDIGANYGATAIFFARLVGPRGQVAAFEPVLSTYLRMCEEIQRDTYEKAAICTFPLGLADSFGYRSIGVPGKAAQASLALSQDESHPESEANTQSALFTTLDAIVAAGGLRPPTVLKVDVEGAEMLVFRGGANVLRETRPVIHVEVFAPWLRRFGLTPWDVLGALSDCGYEFWFACPTGLVKHAPTQAQPYPPAYVDGYNVVCADPSRHQGAIARLSSVTSGASSILPLHPPPMPNR